MTMFFFFILVFYFFLDFYYSFFFLLLWSFFYFFSFSWSGLIYVSDSMMFVLLVLMSIFIMGLVFLSEMNFNMLVLSYILVIISILFFFSFNIIMLYIFFELSMFPIMMMILGYGAQIEKINSSYYLLFYASFCSFPFLYVYMMYNLNFSFVYFDKILSWELVFFLLLGFLMKFPVYFLHLWLPKAHVEAPTTASMLLAGLLLKLGTGGFLRVLKTFSFLHSNFWFFISFLGMILGAFSCIFQSDSKSLAAYSSITHMGFLLMCLLFVSMEGKISSLMIMLSHGYTSTLMFYFIGEMYHITGSRMVYYLNSLFNISSIVSLFFIFTFLSNAGVPPSLSFFSEFISISFGLGYLNYIILILFLYFFFAFYYSIYFITNVIMGKTFYNLLNFSGYYSSFFVLMMFNFFWFSVFF